MADLGPDALLDAARHGDGDALEALLKEVQPRIYRFSLKMCGRTGGRAGRPQETLFAAARTLRGFRGASSVSTWLYTIARSFCIKKRRRSVFAPEVVSLDAGAAAARTRWPRRARIPSGALADRELATALESAIAALEHAAA